MRLNEWPRAKLIVTSRVIPDHGETPLTSRFGSDCAVYTLSPFNDGQRLLFLQKALSWNDDAMQEFERTLAQSPDLEQALTNPFILHLFTRSWEFQEKKLSSLNKYKIYENFVRHWGEQIMKSIPEFRGILCSQGGGNAQHWLSQVSFAMAEARNLSLTVDQVVALKNPWTTIQERARKFALRQHEKERKQSELKNQGNSRSLLSAEQYHKVLLSRVQTWLDQGPLKERNGQYQFMHKSVWEYSLARGVCNQLGLKGEQFQSVLDSGLKPTFLLQDQFALRILCDLATEHEMKRWRKWLEVSRDPQGVAGVANVAACAITALNAVNAIPMNLREIRVPGADLRNAWLNNCDLTSADLSGVQLLGSSLDGACLKQCNLKDIQLGQYPTAYLGREAGGWPLLLAAHPNKDDLVVMLVAALGHIMIINPVTQQTIKSWDVKDVECIAFHPEGTLLACGGGNYPGPGFVELWDVETGTPIKGMNMRHREPVTAVAWNRNGELASGTHSGTIQVWRLDEKTGKMNAQILNWSPQFGNPQAGAIYSRIQALAWSPDGNTLISAHKFSKSWILMWSPKSSATSRELKGVTNPMAIVYSPNGKTLVSGGDTDGKIEIWDPVAASRRGVLTGHTQVVVTLAFNASGLTLASGSCDATVRIWDGQSFTLLAALSGHTNILSSLAFCKNGTVLASVDRSPSLRVWDVPTARARIDSATASVDITSLAYTSNGKLLALQTNPSQYSNLWTKDGTVQIWRTVPNRCRLISPCLKLKCTKSALSPDGDVLALVDDHELKIFNTRAPQTLFTPCQVADYNDLVDSLDSTLRTRIFGLKNFGGVDSLTFSPDSTMLAASIGPNVVLYKINKHHHTFDQLHMFMFHSFQRWCTAFSPDSRILAGGGRDPPYLQLWDTRTGKVLEDPGLTLKASIWSLAFHPDGKTLALARDSQTVCLWRRNKATKFQQTLPTKNVQLLTYNSDGSLLAAAKPRLVQLWDTIADSCIRELCFPTQIRSIGFGDNRLAVGLSQDCGFQVYEMGKDFSLLDRWCSTMSQYLSVNNCDTQESLGMKDNPRNRQVFTQLGAYPEEEEEEQEGDEQDTGEDVKDNTPDDNDPQDEQKERGKEEKAKIRKYQKRRLQRKRKSTRR